jgi:hypothetical protein
MVALCQPALVECGPDIKGGKSKRKRMEVVMMIDLDD